MLQAAGKRSHNQFLRSGEVGRYLGTLGADEPAEVLLLGAPALREVCEPCGANALDEEKLRLKSTLEHFRRENGFGRGIAAPQIGITRRFIALNLGDGPFTLADPEITWRSDEKITLWDDCMSLPWILCKMERHASISIQYTDEAGQLQQWERLPVAESELLQHELDHLDGKLIVDEPVGGGAGIVSREEYMSNRSRFDSEVDHFIAPTIKNE